MMECVGIMRKNGSFENDKGKNVIYDNVLIFYITDDNPDERLVGFFAKEQKVNVTRVRMENFSAWEDLIGKRFELVFNVFTGTPTLSAVKITGDGIVTKWLGEHLREVK